MPTTTVYPKCGSNWTKVYLRNFLVKRLQINNEQIRIMNLKEKALYSIEVLNEDHRLMSEFKKEFPNNTLGQLWDAAKADLLGEEHMHKLVRIMPPFFDINNNIFLYGEDKDGLIQQYGEKVITHRDIHLAELYNITKEMQTGESCIFYTSDVRHFKLAAARYATDAKIFLNGFTLTNKN